MTEKEQLIVDAAYWKGTAELQKERIVELEKERDRWYGAAQERQIKINELTCQKNALQQVNAELEYQVKQLEEYMLKGVAFRDELQAEIAQLKELPNGDFDERMFRRICKNCKISEDMRVVHKETWAKTE